jgi:hypothetical protein
MIPSHCLTEPGRNERADNSQNRRQDEPLGLGFVAGHDELRDKSNDKSDDDRPKDAHAIAPFGQFAHRRLKKCVIA